VTRSAWPAKSSLKTASAFPSSHPVPSAVNIPRSSTWFAIERIPAFPRRFLTADNADFTDIIFEPFRIRAIRVIRG
jgi:hypothetical protein